MQHAHACGANHQNPPYPNHAETRPRSHADAHLRIAWAARKRPQRAPARGREVAVVGAARENARDRERVAGVAAAACMLRLLWGCGDGSGQRAGVECRNACCGPKDPKPPLHQPNRLPDRKMAATCAAADRGVHPASGKLTTGTRGLVVHHWQPLLLS